MWSELMHGQWRCCGHALQAILFESVRRGVRVMVMLVGHSCVSRVASHKFHCCVSGICITEECVTWVFIAME